VQNASQIYAACLATRIRPITMSVTILASVTINDYSRRQVNRPVRATDIACTQRLFNAKTCSPLYKQNRLFVHARWRIEGGQGRRRARLKFPESQICMGQCIHLVNKVQYLNIMRHRMHTCTNMNLKFDLHKNQQDDFLFS